MCDNLGRKPLLNPILFTILSTPPCDRNRGIAPRHLHEVKVLAERRDLQTRRGAILDLDFYALHRGAPILPEELHEVEEACEVVIQHVGEV